MALPTWYDIMMYKGGKLRALYDMIIQVSQGEMEAGSVETADIADEAVTVEKLELAGSEADILVADSDLIPQYVAVSGDITIASTGAVTIADNAVEEDMIASNSVREGALAFKAVAVTVEDTETAGSSAADSDLEDGTILGWHPTGNMDQLPDNIALGGDGAVTVTLAAAATADNTFNVIVLMADSPVGQM